MADTLEARLDEVARTPLLLVATDFDGTLAPIVPDPAVAEADREAIVALRALSSMPQTHVAVISGRALGDLSQRIKELDEAHLIGSHGSEFEAGFITALPADADARLEKLKQFLTTVAEQHEGCWVEVKPASLAFHYRLAQDDVGRAAVELIEDSHRHWLGVHLRPGKKVLELSIIETNKGDALKRIRQRLGATAVLFLGDDLTDEDAFRTLSGPDVGVKIGPGDSLAAFRGMDHIQSARILAQVAERRTDWLAGTDCTPIERHSLLSDQRTIALVDDRSRVVWMCLPRIDSAAMFAQLVGGPTAGYFDIRPVQACNPIGQKYRGDSFVLETQWPTFSVIDYLECGNGRPFQRSGRTDLIRVVSGRGRVRVTFAPRLDFGRMETLINVVAEGVQIKGTHDPVVLRAPGITWCIETEGQNQTAVAEFDLGDQPVVFEMRYGTANLAPDPVPESYRRERTERFWSSWAATLQIPGVAGDLVKRSALVLKALTYGPTGAIAAAGTTSLPEHIGGVRNWDYRFCWPRDAAMAACALLRLGSTGPAMKFLDWLLGILDNQDSATSLLSPVYSVSGRHLGPEAVIAELTGYRGSRPVRIGNAAAKQIQLDMFGPLVDLVATAAEYGAAVTSDHWRMVETIVQAVETRWHEPDHGIWEVRRPRQHHVHSKVMCWHMVDRALASAKYLGHRRPQWERLRDEIATDVLENGYRADVGAYCATYSDSEPDAAALWVGLSGMLAANDPRFIGSIDHVNRSLRKGPTVLRYRYDDGLPGMEGGFHICAGWLVESFHCAGRRDEAQTLFNDLVALAGPTGMLSEQFDPDGGRALGNHPQAYSHLAVINAAIRLAKS